jgi:hypothetical protein
MENVKQDQTIYLACVVKTTERRWRTYEKDKLNELGELIYVHRCPSHKKLKVVEVPFERTGGGNENGDFGVIS